MAEPADASVSKTDEGNLVGVRLPLSAPTRSELKSRLIRPRRGRSQCFPAPDMTGKPTGNPDALAHLNAEVRQMARRAKGEGAVYLRGDRRWEAQLRLGVGRRKSVYGRTRRGGAGQAPRGALEPEKRVASQFAKIDTRRLSGGLAGGGQRARPGQHLRELRAQRPTRQRRAGRGAAAELEPGFDPGQLPAPAPARPEVSPGRPRGRESRPGSGRQRAAWRARSRRGSG